MEYRVLGKTGLKISRLGLGGIPIQRVDAEQTKALMHQLKKKGVNFVDTARGYTVSEEYLGYALEGIREDFVIATKSMSRDAASMAKDVDISLKNLRTDYIDLYQFHNPSPKDLDTILAPGGALEALLSAKAAGKIRHIGITAHYPEVFRRALELDWVETIMFPYHIIENQGAELMELCKEKGIGFICMKPLAGGALDDGTLALRYIMQNDAVSVVIPGMAEEKEVEENVAAVQSSSPLTPEELTKIDEIRSTLGTQFCRRCNYCAPCTVGIPISGVLLFEGYLTRYGLGDWAKQRYQTLAVKPEACVDCGVCETRCPYQLPIRDMLKKAAELLR